MVSAVVLLTTERGKINQVAEALADMAGVSEVYSVGGRFDLVAIIRVADNDTLAELVTNHMLLIEGIVHSETLIAFRVFSRHDLESMFSIHSASAGNYTTLVAFETKIYDSRGQIRVAFVQGNHE